MSDFTENEQELINFVRRTKIDNFALNILQNVLYLYNTHHSSNDIMWQQSIQSIIDLIDNAIYESVQEHIAEEIDKSLEQTEMLIEPEGFEEHWVAHMDGTLERRDKPLFPIEK